MNKLKNGLLALALLWANGAFATAVTFAGAINDPTANHEVNGTEWISQGILLASPTLGLNVGCGVPAPCLGADLATVSDFNGTIKGSFVLPGTLLPSAVHTLGIEFCCEDLIRPPGFDDLTITSIFSTTGALLAQILDTDFTFISAVPIGSFSVDFGSDAIQGIRFNVPEPGTLGLLLTSLLAGLALVRRRRSD